MVNLTDPVGLSNVVAYFEQEIATNKARNGVQYGANAKHYPQIPASIGQFYGGDTPGPSVSSYLATSNLGSTGGTITASTVRSALVNATSSWTHLRASHSEYFESFHYFNQQPSDPRTGNTGPYSPTKGKTHYPTNAQGAQFYAQFNGFIPWFSQLGGTSRRFPQETISTPSASGINSGDLIDNSNTATYFTRLQNEYDAIADIHLSLIAYICHTSCFYSCHFSRGRR